MLLVTLKNIVHNLKGRGSSIYGGKKNGDNTEEPKRNEEAP